MESIPWFQNICSLAMHSENHYSLEDCKSGDHHTNG